MLCPVATRNVFLHTYKKIYAYVYLYGSLQEPARASSPHFLRWHHLEIHACVFTDYRMICSPGNDRTRAYSRSDCHRGWIPS